MPLTPIRPQELPYVSHAPTDGRIIPALPFLDESGKWHAYVRHPKGGLVEIRPIDAAATCYLSKGDPPTARDTHMPLCHVVTQHFSFADTMGVLRDIEDDYLNSLASLHKYFVLLNYAKTAGELHPSALIRTELEFAFGNHRSFYDLLTALFISMYKRFIIHDREGRQVRPASIPGSFSRLLRKSDDELARQFHLPKPLIDFHRGKAGVFGRLCKIRDNIAHHGHTADFVFTAPDGFALSLGDKMWGDLKAMDIWPARLLKPNGLASVLGLLVFLVRDMEESMSGLSRALGESFVQMPQPIAEGYKVYLRDHLVVHCAHLDEYGEQHWLDPGPVLEMCHSEWAHGTE